MVRADCPAMRTIDPVANTITEHGWRLRKHTPEEDTLMSNQGRYRQRLSTFAANWRALALRGFVALLFGLTVLFWPGLILAALSLLFGIYALEIGRASCRERV